MIQMMMRRDKNSWQKEYKNWPKKHQSPQKLADTDPQDSDDDEEEKEPKVKKHQSPEGLLKQTQQTQGTQMWSIS